MVSRRRLLVIGLLVLECAICIVVGSFFYRQFQKRQQEEKAQYIVKLNQTAIQATASGELHYFYQPKPDVINTNTPDWLGYGNLQTYNHDGLNERFNYSVVKNPNTLRILTLGDSFTHGDFVPTQQNWTELLEDALNQSGQKLCAKNKVEVINLGVSGYDVEYVVRRYKILGAKYQPDLIIWFESGSGFYRHNELAQPLIRPCQDRFAIEYPNGSDSEKMIYEYNCWMDSTKKVREVHTPLTLRNRISTHYREFFDVVGMTPVLVFGYPSSQEEDLQAMTKYYLKGHQNALFLPVVPYLTETTRLADGHPNPSGHLVIQQTILAELLKQQSRFCPAATSSTELQ